MEAAQAHEFLGDGSRKAFALASPANQQILEQSIRQYVVVPAQRQAIDDARIGGAECGRS